MARYLLGANTLVDLCYEGTSAIQWAKEIAANEMCISVLSVTIAREVVKRSATTLAECGRIQQALDIRITTMITEGALVLPFANSEANEWQKWRDHAPLDAYADGALCPVGQDTRMTIATAFANGLELVEPAEAYHEELRHFGLDVRSL